MLVERGVQAVIEHHQEAGAARGTILHDAHRIDLARGKQRDIRHEVERCRAAHARHAEHRVPGEVDDAVAAAKPALGQPFEQQAACAMRCFAGAIHDERLRIEQR